MKILFVCQYFYPEVFRGNDIAFQWAEDGHEVHVVCGVPNYPDGVFHKGYGWFKRRHEVINGVKVTRLPIIPRGNKKIMLMLNYFSYLIVGFVYMLFHALFHKYDRVFVQQLSPVMMSAPGVLYKKLRRVPLYTWVMGDSCLYYEPMNAKDAAEKLAQLINDESLQISMTEKMTAQLAQFADYNKHFNDILEFLVKVGEGRV